MSDDGQRFNPSPTTGLCIGCKAVDARRCICALMDRMQAKANGQRSTSRLCTDSYVRRIAL